MTDIALTAAKIGAVYKSAEIIDMIAAVAITRGQALYQTSSGTVGLADANVTDKKQFIGIALEAASIGKVVPVLKRGHCYGFTLTSQTYEDAVYLSDTEAVLGDSAGTLTVGAGRVVALPDSDLTKVIYIEALWGHEWA